MNIIDLHCDTLTKIADNPETNLLNNKFSVDINRMKNTNYIAQVFAVFIEKEIRKDAKVWAEKLIDIFNIEMANNSNLIKQSFNYNDIIENQKKGILSSLLSIEEGAALEGSLDNLVEFYKKGVVILTLTWNYTNEIGYPNYLYKYVNNGLTSFGKELVEYMNDIKMIVDVSHLSDAGFYDVAKICKKPFIASHSNSRTIKEHPRNLTDEMIKILASKGGTIGINFFAPFLGESNFSKIDDMIRHIKHIEHIGGIDCISIGSDFDGIESVVEIKDCSYMDKLWQALRKQGFNEDALDKIFFKNALRVIKDVL